MLVMIFAIWIFVENYNEKTMIFGVVASLVLSVAGFIFMAKHKENETAKIQRQ